MASRLVSSRLGSSDDGSLGAARRNRSAVRLSSGAPHDGSAAPGPPRAEMTGAAAHWEDDARGYGREGRFYGVRGPIGSVRSLANATRS